MYGLKAFPVLVLAILLIVLPPPVAGAAPASAPSISVGGLVQGPGGAPVEGARVSLLPFAAPAESFRLELEGRVHPEPAATAVTDAGGAFRLQAPGIGLWKVLVEARGLVPMEILLTPLLDEMELPAARLERDAGLSVTVAAADGTPLAGARVRVEPAPDPGTAFRADWREPARSALTDAKGTAVLPRAVRESLLVRAGAASRPVARQENVRAASVTLRLPAGVAREIRVLDAAGRKPEAGVSVRLGDDAWAAGRTSADGLFSVPLGPGRKERVLLVAEDGRRLSASVAPAGKNETGPLVLRLGALETLSGRVVSASGGRPVAGALVWADDPGVVRKSGADGAYTIPKPILEVPLRGAAPGYFPGIAHLDPGARRGPTVLLEPALSAGGVVVDEGGKPVPGVEIRATPRFESGMRMLAAGNSGGTARTSAAGRFRLGLLAPGLGHDLRLTRKGFAPAEAEIPPLAHGRPVADLRIVLRKGRTAHGRVLDQAEQPVAGAEVVLSLSPAEGRMGRFFRSLASGAPGLEATTAADGRFEIRDLPAGTYELTARGRGYAPLTVPGLAIPAGAGTTDLGTVLLVQGVAVEGLVVDPEGRPVPGAEITVSEAGNLGMRALLRRQGNPEPPVLTGSDGSFRIEDRRPGETLGLGAWRAGYAAADVPGVQVPSERPVRIVLQPTAAVEGRVVDPDGRPIAGATVVAFASDRMRMRVRVAAAPGPGPATTDDSGLFRVEGMEPGTIEIRAMAAGFQAAWLKNLELRPGQDLRGVEVVLAPGAVVEGRVLSPSGRPVSGAQVTLAEMESRGGVFDPVGAISDGDGRYRLEGVGPGPRAVQAEHPDYRRAVRELEVRLGENTLDLTLEGGAEVRGRVVDEAGAPVANARVMLRQGFRSWELPSTGSGPDGSFTLTSVPEGTYAILAQKEGFAMDREGQELVVAGGSVGGVEVRLSRGGAVVGQLLGLEFTELSQVQVRVYGAPAEGIVAPDGSYRVDHVAPGTWRVVASLPDGSRQAEGEVALEPGAAEARLDLAFEEGHTLTGRVLRDGRALTGAGVSLSSPQSSSRFVSTDHEGRFRFADLPAGEYQLMVLVGPGEPQHVEPLEMDGDRDVLVELRAVSVSGRVIDDESRRPIANAEVTLVIPDGAGPGRFPVSTGTDSRGMFQLRGVSEGTWRLRALASGYAPDEATVEVADAPVEGVEIALRATEGLTLEVFLPSGRPPQRVRTALLDAAGRVVSTDALAVAEDGRVRMSSIGPGTWELVLEADGAAPLSLSVTAPGNAGRVVLPQAGGLEVRVPALASDPAPARLRLTDAAGRPFRAPWAGQAQGEVVLSHGAGTLQRVAVGTWKLTVTAGDGRTWSGTATVVPGRVEQVTLE